MEHNSQNSRENSNIMSSANSNLNEGHGSLVGNIRIGRVNFQRRTAEGSRLLRENFHTVFEEIRPLVEQARTVNQAGISLTTLLNRQQSRNDNTSSATDLRDSFVINLGDSTQGQIGQQLLNNTNGTHIHIHNHAADNILNNIREATSSLEQNNSNNNNNHEEANAAEALRQVPEARALLEILQKYIPFVLILLAKGLYDHREGILNFIILFICFTHSNSIVKREAGKQHRKSLTSLLVQVCYILGCIFFIGYIFEDQYLFSNLIFIPPYTQPLSVWDLIWTVGITDFMLKLITILFKIVIVSLPAHFLPYQKRGKYYLLAEATSQLYRSIAPIQPWLYYLLESYQGPEKIAGVFLSAAYMVSKGSDLMIRMRLFKTAVFKAFQNVTLGSAPSKEQLQSTGTQCPICHDDYNTPVLLQCRHIFCEACVSTWFDREQTCPLCRAKVVDDPSWRDGSTTYFTQLF